MRGHCEHTNGDEAMHACRDVTASWMYRLKQSGDEVLTCGEIGRGFKPGRLWGGMERVSDGAGCRDAEGGYHVFLVWFWRAASACGVEECCDKEMPKHW